MKVRFDPSLYGDMEMVGSPREIVAEMQSRAFGLQDLSLREYAERLQGGLELEPAPAGADDDAVFSHLLAALSNTKYLSIIES